MLTMKIMLKSPGVQYHFFCFLWAEDEAIIPAPLLKSLHLFSVGHLVVVGDSAYYNDVIGKFYDCAGIMGGFAVMCEEGE